jgi:hypothetical protein
MSLPQAEDCYKLFNCHSSNIFGCKVLLLQLHNSFYLKEYSYYDMTLKHNNLCLKSQPCESPTLINLTYTELLEGNNIASGYYTIDIRNVLWNNVCKFTFVLNSSSYTNILQKFTEFSLDVGSHTICPNVIVFLIYIGKTNSHAT